MLAIDAELVVQVRPGGQAGGTDIADDLALADPLAGAVLAKARHVRIQRGVAATVIQDHRVAIAALHPGKLHPGIAGGHDRGAGAGGVVHALVHAHAAQYRMTARAEIGAQAGKLDWRADEALLQRPAVGVKVLGLAIALETEAGIGLAASSEGGGQHLGRIDTFALAPGLVIHHVEAVARLDILGEVDVVLEDLVGQYRDRIGRQARPAGRGIQRMTDFAAGHRGTGGGLAGGDGRSDFLALQVQLDPVARVTVETQPVQLALGRDVEGDFGTWAQARKGGTRMLVFQHPVHDRGRQLQFVEDGAKGLPGAHLQGVPGRCRLVRLDLFQCRQFQRQAGLGVTGGCDRLRKPGDDRGDHQPDAGEQAGVNPVAAGPAFVESSRQVLPQTAVQAVFVLHRQTGLEALFAQGVRIAVGHHQIPD